jgi:hypothetical protein
VNGRRRHLAVLFALLAGLGLPACGESDEDKIRDLVNKIATSNDVANCDSLYTERGRQAFQREANQTCQEVTKAEDPRADLKISNLNVDGDKATATVEGSRGQIFDFTFVKEDDEWKVDDFVVKRPPQGGAGPQEGGASPPTETETAPPPEQGGGGGGYP